MAIRRDRHRMFLLLNPEGIRVPPKAFLHYGAAHLGYATDEITGPDRSRGTSNARNILVFAALSVCSARLVDTSAAFNRNHSTMMYIYTQALQRYRENLTFRTVVNEVVGVVFEHGRKKGFRNFSEDRRQPLNLILAHPPVSRPFDDDYRKVHRAHVAYARRLYASQGDQARWPVVRLDNDDKMLCKRKHEPAFYSTGACD